MTAMTAMTKGGPMSETEAPAADGKYLREPLVNRKPLIKWEVSVFFSRGKPPRGGGAMSFSPFRALGSRKTDPTTFNQCFLREKEQCFSA